MKITDVVATIFQRELPVVPRWAPNGGKETMGVLTIETDEGVKGHTFYGWRPTAEELVPLVQRVVKPLLIGRNPLDRGAIWQELWSRRNVIFPLIGSVDVALWDLAGRAANMPIHRLIGSHHDKIGAYVGNSGLPKTPGAYVDDVRKQRARGYQGYKIHSTADLRTDINICTAVRNAVGDDYPLMFDLHARYGFESVIKIGLVLQELDFVWLEDPMEGDDIYGYSRLKQQLHISLLACEGYPNGPYGHDEWLINKATDYLRGDVIRKCGITGLLQVAHLAEMFRVPFEVHHFGHSCNNIANLNVVMAIPNAGMYEVNLPDEFFKYGMISDADVDADGFVHAPTGPGLGHEIDWDLVNRTKVGEFR